MSKKKLGRGLDALLGDYKESSAKTNTVITESKTFSENADDSEKAEQAFNQVINVDPKSLKPNPHQPRTTFSESSLAELAVSIKEHGIIQPVVVTEAENGELFILAGERRTRASIIAGIKEIPVILADIEPEQNLELALIENIQREDLNPIEEATAFKKLLEMYDLSQDELAKKLGKSRPAITNSLRLLQLPNYALEAVRTNKISQGHARAILSVVLDSEKKQLFDKIINENISVREAEALASKFNAGEKHSKPNQKPKSSKPNKLSPELESLQQKFLEALGTKVVIKGSEDKGILQISYFSKDDLNHIYEKIIDN
ncbi:MAG: ParB/RepB/Spo0J family partition protein [Treponemataceae bacterium]